MSDDTYSEVTRQSWGSRIKGALGGIVFGLILIAVSVWLLFGNEGRAVRQAKGLTEGGGAVVSVSADRVDPAHEGDLVHVTGQAETSDMLRDPAFGATVRALHLERRVEMYQWREDSERETDKKLGGGTETRTTTSYERVWSDDLIDSSRFQQPAGHINPAAFPIGSRQVSADRVTLGAFRLPSSMVDDLNDFRSLEITSLRDLPQEMQSRAQLREDHVYVGSNPAQPEVGDLRIRLAYVPPGPVSVVAQQVGNSFSPYATRAGGTLLMVRSGIASAEAMFQAAERSNRTLTWLLRAGGFLMMFFGISLVLRPLSVLADVVPFIGTMVGAGTGFIAFLLAALGSLVVISVAWVFYRPMLGLFLLILAVLVVVWIVRRMRRGGQRRESRLQPATNGTSSRGTSRDGIPPPPAG